jgi:hypothetical protein
MRFALVLLAFALVGCCGRGFARDSDGACFSTPSRAVALSAMAPNRRPGDELPRSATREEYCRAVVAAGLRPVARTKSEAIKWAEEALCLADAGVVRITEASPGDPYNREAIDCPPYRHGEGAACYALPR